MNSYLKACLTGQIYPYNYTLALSMQINFPKDKPLKNKQSGKNSKAAVVLQWLCPLSGRDVSQGVHRCHCDTPFKFNVRFLAAML